MKKVITFDFSMLNFFKALNANKEKVKDPKRQHLGYIYFDSNTVNAVNLFFNFSFPFIAKYSATTTRIHVPIKLAINTTQSEKSEGLAITV